MFFDKLDICRPTNQSEQTHRQHLDGNYNSNNNRMRPGLNLSRLNQVPQIGGAS